MLDDSVFGCGRVRGLGMFIFGFVMMGGLFDEWGFFE